MQGESVGYYFADGGVMVVRNPLQGSSRYSGQMTWSNQSGATFCQTFSFTTTVAGGSRPTPQPTGTSRPVRSRPVKRRVTVKITSVKTHRHRLSITVQRTAAAKGKVQLYAASIGRGGVGRYRRLATGSRAKATFTIGLARGRWSVQARFSGSGWTGAEVTRRITVR